MTNDFPYAATEIDEEEIFKGWEELANEQDEADYIPGLDDGEWMEEEEDADWDVYGEEEFA